MRKFTAARVWMFVKSSLCALFNVWMTPGGTGG
jgi:hypothetical protein